MRERARVLRGAEVFLQASGKERLVGRGRGPRESTTTNGAVVAIDRLELRDLDYVDGERRPPSGVVPVVVKSLAAQLPVSFEGMTDEFIEVHGARENNLKDVSLDIPKRKITVFTGVSGFGKSSLVFDTIAAEAQRQLNETFTLFVQGFLPH